LKYDLQEHWQEVQQTSIKGKDGRFLNIGEVTSALKRSWKAYKVAGQNGEPRGDIAWRINLLEDGLGLTEKEIFPEIQEMGGYDENQDQDQEQLSAEDLQLLREEKQDQLERQQEVLGNQFGDQATEESESDDWSGSETSLDKQLIKEEEEDREDFVQRMVHDIKNDDDW
jgi:hypothetical protein